MTTGEFKARLGSRRVPKINTMIITGEKGTKTSKRKQSSIFLAEENIFVKLSGGGTHL